MSTHDLPWELANLSSAIDTALEDWSVPNGVPARVNGGILPRPQPGAPLLPQLYPLARTITILVERIGRGTFILLGDHDRTLPSALLPAAEWPNRFGSPHSETTLRLTAESTDFVLDSHPAPTELTESWNCLLAVCALLAPGWEWIPVLVPSPRHGDPVKLGSTLGERFFGQGNVVILAVSTLTRYGPERSFAPAGVGPSAERWVHENDARVVKYLETLSAERIVQEVMAQRSASDPGALAAAASAARRRDGWTGHVVGYESQRPADEPIFQSAVSLLGMVF